MFEKYASFYNLIYKNRDYKAEAKFVYKWAGKPKCIVDLGSGTGRHHKYWDCCVVGIDQSKEMLRYCKPSKKRVYLQDNIEKLNLSYAPCYTALFNVIGYCDLDKVMSCLKQNKGDVFIFDCWDRDKVAKIGFKTKEKLFPWGKVNIIPYLGGLIILITKKNGETVIEKHDAHPYSEKEIKRFCKKYGYSYIRKDTKTWTTYYKLTKT